MVLADLYLPRRESFSVLNFNKLDHVVELVKTQYVDDVNTDSLQDTVRQIQALQKELNSLNLDKLKEFAKSQTVFDTNTQKWKRGLKEVQAEADKAFEKIAGHAKSVENSRFSSKNFTNTYLQGKLLLDQMVKEIFMVYVLHQ